MKAIRIHQFGPPEVMTLEEVPTPTPGPGEVLVRSHSIGVGIPDKLMRTGVYYWTPPLPMTMGIEVSGVVEAVGPGVRSLQIGQPIVSYVNGCYAEHVVIPEERVFPMPEGVDLEAAVTLPIVYQTAYHLLHTVARVTAGQRALVYAAAGATGTALVQLAKLAGLAVVGTASTEEKTDFAQAQGADHVVHTATESVPARVAEITEGRGVDVIFTPGGDESFGTNYEMLAPLGQIVLYSRLIGWPGSQLLMPSRPIYEKSPGIRLFSMHVFDRQPEVKAKTVAALGRLLAEKAIRPVIYRRLPLAEAVHAHRLLESRAVMGKVVLDPA